MPEEISNQKKIIDELDKATNEYAASFCNKYNILGVNLDGKLYSKENFDAQWVKVNDDSSDLGNIFTDSDGKVYSYKKKDITDPKITILPKITKFLYKDKWNDPKWLELKDISSKIVDLKNKIVIKSNKVFKEEFEIKSTTFNLPVIKDSSGYYGIETGFILQISSDKKYIFDLIQNNTIIFNIFDINKNTIDIYADRTLIERVIKNLKNKQENNSELYINAITIVPNSSNYLIGFSSVNNGFYIADISNNKNDTLLWKGPYGKNNNKSDIFRIALVKNKDCSKDFLSNLISSIFKPLKESFLSLNFGSIREGLENDKLVSLKGQTFWGQKGIQELSKNTLNECSALCASISTCTGATFNSDKKYCWIRGGEGSTMPGMINDYAIVPERTQLIKKIYSLNSQLNKYSEQDIKKINDFYKTYTLNNDVSADENVNLIKRYNVLNNERNEINNIISEYQTLEEIENEMGIYITKNYYLFFIFFIIVFISFVILIFLSIDQNTKQKVGFVIADTSQKIQSVLININPFYVMFTIILFVVIIHLYNQYNTSFYNKALSLKKMTSSIIMYIMFILVIIFIVFAYYNTNIFKE